MSEDELFDFMMVLSKVASDTNGLLTMLELSRLRGDLYKMWPILKERIPELVQSLNELSEKIPDANG